MTKFIFHVRKLNYGMGVELDVAYRHEDRTFVGQPVEFRELDDMAPVSSSPASAITIRNTQGEFEALQSLMDQLWEIGVRPSDIGTPGHLAATSRHLEDMRRLVEHGTGVKFVATENAKS